MKMDPLKKLKSKTVLHELLKILSLQRRFVDEKHRKEFLKVEFGKIEKELSKIKAENSVIPCFAF